MGLFKETISDYLVKQLEVRQELLSIEKNRSATPAFHNYTLSKYCNIRMASGVDITNNELLELTSDMTIGNIKLEEDLKGHGLA